MKVLIVLAALCALAFGAQLKTRTPRLDGRIVGGQDSNIEDLPHQLSLQSNNRHICGASIIHPDWALTAAHCVYGSPTSQISLRAGSSIRGNGGQVHQASQIICHPQYTSWTTDYDYCLIQVSRPFNVEQPGIRAIALAGQEPSEGNSCIASGWGALWANGPSPSQLQSVELPIIGRPRCQELYSNYDITERMICAGYEEGGKDSCQGDSGGPLIQDQVLVGIVSWGLGCAGAGNPGVYASVANQRDWITTTCGCGI